ncbi:MAG TPA: discoidin domain-containing protein [Verrucomicrobiae bacterium]
MKTLLSLLLLASACAQPATAAVYNLKIVTDASPDYSDLNSLVRSATSKWQTPEEKCWAMFYWNHIARRQTAPMMLHGLALTDPIRQFNDYGYTMCSTISGINCSIWDAMQLKPKYWDISLHTVPEVEYGGRWHMYDNSMSALYTLCDGKTIAGVRDIGQAGACEASHGKVEAGHIAKYHCLYATSPHGFLSGADTIRSVEEEAHCFNTNGLKFRTYFYDWDRGHRYILNLRENESYTRYFHSLGKSPDYYVANEGKDPEKANERYRIRGNGVWLFKPNLPADSMSLTNLSALGIGSLAPATAQQPSEIIFKINGANVITALKVRAKLFRKSDADAVNISLSTVNGLSWQQCWSSDAVGEQTLEREFVPQVNGAYEVLVKITLLGRERGMDAQLRQIEFETKTMLNSKTQPKLMLGKNSVYIGAGEQSDSIVLWPDLRGTNYKAYAVAETNIKTSKNHPGYMGVMSATKAKEEAYVVFRADAPRDITRLNYGGRLYNRFPGSHIDFFHSFDDGKTWTKGYTLTNTAQPWDVIHYETVENVPSGTRSVLFKYSLTSRAAGPDACSLYAVRMEVNHQPIQGESKPVQLTFNWSERQPDYSLVERSYTELAPALPHRFNINVGGADHPVVNWLKVSALPENTKPGYSDGKDAGGEKFMPRWQSIGKNLALGKPYTVSVPSGNNWGAGDPEGKKLTDGVVGPPYPGATAPASGLLWNKGQKPEITVDLGAAQSCGAFRIQVGAGWPWWDAMRGQVKDKVEVLTSDDGQSYSSRGFFDFNLRWKDLPVNLMWPDDETFTGQNFELLLPQPVSARYVRFKITPERTMTVSEVQALDFIKYEPFDLRVALPPD